MFVANDLNRGSRATVSRARNPAAAWLPSPLVPMSCAVVCSTARRSRSSSAIAATRSRAYQDLGGTHARAAVHVARMPQASRDPSRQSRGSTRSRRGSLFALFRDDPYPAANPPRRLHNGLRRLAPEHTPMQPLRFAHLRRGIVDLRECCRNFTSWATFRRQVLDAFVLVALDRELQGESSRKSPSVPSTT